MRTFCLALLAAAICSAQPYTVTAITCKDASGAVDTHQLAPGQSQTCTATLSWTGNAPPAKITVTVGGFTYDFTTPTASSVTITIYGVTFPAILTPAFLSVPIATGTSTASFTVTYPAANP